MHVEAIREMTRLILAHKVADRALSFRAGVNQRDGNLELEPWWTGGVPLGRFRNGLVSSLRAKAAAYNQARKRLPSDQALHAPTMACFSPVGTQNGGVRIFVTGAGATVAEKIRDLKSAERAIVAVRNEFDLAPGQTKKRSG